LDKVLALIISLIIAILCFIFISDIISAGISLFGEAIRITVVGLVNFITNELGLGFIHFT
jgi:hypothetical protein